MLNSPRAQGKKFRNKVSTPRKPNKTPTKKSINTVQPTPTRQSSRKRQPPRQAASPSSKTPTPRKRANPSAAGRAKTPLKRSDPAGDQENNGPKANPKGADKAATEPPPRSPPPPQTCEQGLPSVNSQSSTSLPQPATQQAQNSDQASPGPTDSSLSIHSTPPSIQEWDQATPSTSMDKPSPTMDS